MNCPNCGAVMSSGFLVAESLMEGAKWKAKKTRLAAGGDALVDPDTWGNVYVGGFRCTSCRTLVLSY